MLYDVSGRAEPLRDWPEPRMGETEAAFLQSLAKHLSDQACNDAVAGGAYAEALLKEIAGGYTPRDPLLEAEIARILEERIHDALDPCPGIKRLPPAQMALITRAAHEGPLNGGSVARARWP